ncbi:MAG: hypothetical protein AAGC76_02710 [Luteibacter sp.]|jgi:type II secretory pathway pseudopilin PulG|uniref:pilus assembly FimT family protein n=1 Tax=Luteibacter sp. TaxID=1886636 RepID=UPI0028081D10|nr:hypothetical protein [Luteibacter sp.]MDQ7994742.1 hypothetical protein [Luteibacter sp.]MDQ8050066.1 hypothetical protein [Luteibacter sp.]
MKHRGSSVVELLCSLAVAGIVAGVVAVSLGSAGLASRRHLRSMERSDAARQALAILADDLAESKAWGVCTDARDCPLIPAGRPYRSYVVHTDAADWLVGKGLRRCVEACDALVDDIVGLDVLADVPDESGRVRRVRFLQWHGNAARLLEVSIRFADGTRFSRVVARR